MPVISMFYGIIVSLYFMDQRRHKRPHIHVKYQNEEAVIAIPEGDGSGGDSSSRKDAIGRRVGRDSQPRRVRLADQGR